MFPLKVGVIHYTELEIKSRGQIADSSEKQGIQGVTCSDEPLEVFTTLDNLS